VCLVIGLMVQPDHWTCPTCGVTDISGCQDAGSLWVAIRLAQEQHARDHAPQPPRECPADDRAA
jgi:hypothetical protein